VADCYRRDVELAYDRECISLQGSRHCLACFPDFQPGACAATYVRAQDSKVAVSRLAFGVGEGGGSVGAAWGSTTAIRREENDLRLSHALSRAIASEISGKLPKPNSRRRPPLSPDAEQQ
jgi:hypothetical protein